MIKKYSNYFLLIFLILTFLSCQKKESSMGSKNRPIRIAFPAPTNLLSLTKQSETFKKFLENTTNLHVQLGHSPNIDTLKLSIQERRNDMVVGWGNSFLQSIKDKILVNPHVFLSNNNRGFYRYYLLKNKNLKLKQNLNNLRVSKVSSSINIEENKIFTKLPNFSPKNITIVDSMEKGLRKLQERSIDLLIVKSEHNLKGQFIKSLAQEFQNIVQVYHRSSKLLNPIISFSPDFPEALQKTFLKAFKNWLKSGNSKELFDYDGIKLYDLKLLENTFLENQLK